MSELGAGVAERTAVDIAVGIVQREDGAVLIGQRPGGKPWAGWWEFPGGKVEDGEAVPDALARELREELGIEVQDSAPLLVRCHDYPERRVRLHVRRVTAHAGTVRPREDQALAWVQPGALGDWSLLPADGPIVTALRLPQTYVFTPPHEPPETWLGGLARLPRGSLVRLRRPDHSESEYLEEAALFADSCRGAGLRPMLDRDPRFAMEYGTGWHATSAVLAKLRDRPMGLTGWFAASVHDAREAATAAGVGADLVVAGPVAETRTHPDARPLGWDGFQDRIREAGVAAYAIGGLGPEDVARARAAGAIGVAGISAFWAGSLRAAAAGHGR